MSNKIKLTYSGSTKNGIVKMRQSAKFRQEVLQCFPECEITITVTKKKKVRSSKQNAYYWSCLIPIVRQGLTDIGNLGVTNEMAHSFLKITFNPKSIFDKEGNIKEVPDTTTQLSTSGFMDYIAQIQIWAIEFLGVTIPDPKEQTELELN